MNTKFFNLALMCLWLVLCLGLLTREWWMPDEMNEKVTGPQTPLIIVVAGLLAVWNFARFFVAYRFGTPTRPSPEVEEYRRKIRALSGHDPQVTDPQFKFDAPPPEERPAGDRPT
jgi:hypothetical protein